MKQKKEQNILKNLHAGFEGNQIRIGIDARFLLRPLRGIPLYVLHLCLNLPALRTNYQFYYFINKGFEHNDRPENYQNRLDRIQNYKNVTIVNKDDDAEIRWEQIYLKKLIKQYRIDLLHMPANRVCFFPGVPTIVTIHDIMEYLFLSRIHPIPKTCDLRMMLYVLRKRGYVWWNYKYGIKKASKIISVSHYSANDLKSNLNCDDGHIKVIHHGIDNDFFLTKNNYQIGIEESDNISSQPYVLMLGGDSYQKNPEGAIKAWSLVNPNIRKQYHLKIIGFSGDQNSPLIRALKKNNLADEVEVSGWVTQNELIKYFHRASLFLCLSRYEGFGFPILQAMASGTPIISTNMASLPEILGNVGFQFLPDDHIGISKAIESVLQDNRMQAEQSSAGIKRAENFSWQHCVEEHIRIYEEVLQNK